MKRVFFGACIIAVTGLSFAAYYSYGSIEHKAKTTPEQSMEKANNIYSQKENNDSFPDFRTYTNEKYGFSFRYPTSWIKSDKEAEVKNLSGALTSIEIYFTDTIQKVTLLSSYHLAPAGAELFKYQTSQFETKQGWYANNGASKIIVAGKTAIVAQDTISKNGKGYSINPALKSIIVDFLDDAHTGEFELQFKCPLVIAEKEKVKFNHLLSTFRFKN